MSQLRVHVSSISLDGYGAGPDQGLQEMEGGTTFFFVTDGIEAALRRAAEAAGGRNIRLGGGAGTIRQYPSAPDWSPSAIRT